MQCRVTPARRQLDQWRARLLARGPAERPCPRPLGVRRPHRLRPGFDSGCMERDREVPRSLLRWLPGQRVRYRAEGRLAKTTASAHILQEPARYMRSHGNCSLRRM
eukprot:6453720-Prymnesium_polylepis.1